MKKKIVVFIAFILISCSFLSASAEIYPLSSPIYENMDLLYQLTGLSSPSSARPWSTQEAKLILSRLDKTKIGENLLWLYSETEEIINEPLRINVDDKAYFDASIDINTEVYYHTNKEDYRTDLDWNYGFEERKPLAKLTLEFGLSDWAYVVTDLVYSRNRYHSDDYRRRVEELFVKDGDKGGLGAIVPPIGTTTAEKEANHGWMHLSMLNYSNPFMTNFLLPSYNFDFTWPKRSVFAILGDNYSFSLSKDKIKWGNGVTGNFIVDDHTDFNDFIRASAFTQNFKYDFLLLFFNMKYTNAEASPDTRFKVLLAHRLEYRILDKVTLSVSENVAYQNNFFDLQYLNPAYIYHNLNNRAMFNAIAHLELDFILPFGFRGYFQYVMDQAQAPNEDASQSDASGYMVGLNYAKAFKNKSILDVNAEFVYTTPVLYRRDLVDFLNIRNNFNHGSSGGSSYVMRPEYVGYQYGGDALVFQLDANYKLPTWGNIYGSFFFMKHGKMNYYISHNVNGDNSDDSDYKGKTPTGDESEIETTYRFTLGAEVNILINVKDLDVKLWTQADYYMVNNKSMFNLNSTASATNGNLIINKKGWSNDFQFSFGVGISY